MAGAYFGKLYLMIPKYCTNVTNTEATAWGTINSVMGSNVTTRGLIYYPYSDTEKIIGDVDVTNMSENGSFTAGMFSAEFTGLLVNARYNFKAHATNGVGITYGSRVDFWTLANVPLSPTINNATATTLDVTINANSNPDSTKFCIQDSVNNKFVQADGSLNTTAVWQTVASWGTKTVTSLTTGATYYFRVKAREGQRRRTFFCRQC